VKVEDIDEDERRYFIIDRTKNMGYDYRKYRGQPEEKFVLINLDSGSVASEKGAKSSIVQKGIWGDPWKKRRENEENLIAACSLGRLKKAVELLNKSI
jgi:hypothetical protein